MSPQKKAWKTRVCETQIMWLFARSYLFCIKSLTFTRNAWKIKFEAFLLFSEALNVTCSKAHSKICFQFCKLPPTEQDGLASLRSDCRFRNWDIGAGDLRSWRAVSPRNKPARTVRRDSALKSRDCDLCCRASCLINSDRPPVVRRNADREERKK